MKCVVIESPYAGDVQRNTEYARACALDSLKRKGGTIVMQGRPVPDFPFPKLAAKYGAIRICRGHNHSAVAQAAEWIASGRYNIELVASHQFPLVDTARACLASGGEGVPDPVNVTVNPWLEA